MTSIQNQEITKQEEQQAALPTATATMTNAATNIQVFNTLSGKKEPFVPLNGNNVTIYACGPTVYDASHLGHARMAIVWDVIQRYLRFVGYSVTFVRNITDVDDKIIKKAAELNLKPDQVSREYTYQYWKDMHDLNVSQPDYEPKATEFVQGMITFAEKLIAAGHAYAVKGDVYFDVKSFKEYGKLGKQDVEKLMSGAREQVRSQEELQGSKRNPVDFALWKSAKPNELSWPSPWGNGRPGWHLECSTMIHTVLGDTIDIHGGGEDLVFPHHENEIAQSESLTGKQLAKYWLHNSFVQVSSEKMSKSLGNFKTIQDLLKSFSPDTIRLLILQTHYRNPIDFTNDSLVAAKTAMNRMIRASAMSSTDVTVSQTPEVLSAISSIEKDFIDAMGNDFNTAQAMTALFALVDKINQTKNPNDQRTYALALQKYAGVLGMTLRDNRHDLNSDSSSQLMDLVLELRKGARARKDFPTADLIRDKLNALGISVMDGASGASWERT